jgi:hypothetical protein
MAMEKLGGAPSRAVEKKWPFSLYLGLSRLSWEVQHVEEVVAKVLAEPI